jgi:hypothetical protein
MNKRFSTQVEPSNRLFEELGNNTYDFRDLLSELIDNSIAARYSDRLLHVVIKIIVDKDNNPRKFIIRDDAKGIPDDELGIAISPAAKKTENSLNEHGLGMKQAVASLGKLESLVTKTDSDEHAKKITEFKWGEIDVFNVEDHLFQSSGTQITVVDLKNIVTSNASSLTRTYKPYLGARYRKFLKANHKKLDLRIVLQTEGDEDPFYEEIIEEVKPTYFHPQTRENRPVIQSYNIDGDSWKARLTFGYAPTMEGEFEELGLEKPNKWHPYRISRSTQGLDIFLHDRVILFHQLHEIGLVAGEHSDYNDIRGEIELINGFSTAITKNELIRDKNFNECIKEIDAILNGRKSGPSKEKKDYLKRKTYPENLPEKLLRDRLHTYLETNPLNKKESVESEYVIEGIEGFIDLLADDESWEIKTSKAGALDVYQLFMYMDVGKLDKGFLVASDFTTGANIAKKHIEKAHNKSITLAKLDDFPINHPASLDERETYL